MARLRLLLRFVALFLLTLSGAVQGARIAAVPALQACVCGCDAPSDELCGCKGNAAPVAPVQTPQPCSEPSRGCSTNINVNTSMLTASKKAETLVNAPEPQQEPHAWPLGVAQVASDAGASLLRSGSGFRWELPRCSRCLQRLALLSVFRN